MGRLIDTNDIRVKPKYMQDVMGIAMIRCEDLSRILADVPTVEAIPKDQYEARFKIGKWIAHRKSDGEVGYFQCSSCNHNSVGKFPYCPICGAEMDCSPNILSEMEAIPKDIYETRLKADMVAMLEDIRKKIKDKSWSTVLLDGNSLTNDCHFADVNWIIQQKINELKAESEEKRK